MSIGLPQPLGVQALTDWTSHVDPAVLTKLQAKQYVTQEELATVQVVQLKVDVKIPLMDIMSAGDEAAQDAYVQARLIEGFAALATDLQTLNANCKILGYLSLPGFINMSPTGFELSKGLFVFPVIEVPAPDKLDSLHLPTKSP